jgi:hypothetical protein
MAAVKMWIDKFGGVVKIDSEHPLAIAQREKDAAAPKVVPEVAAEPAPVPVEDVPEVEAPAKPKPRKRRARKG